MRHKYLLPILAIAILATGCGNKTPDDNGLFESTSSSSSGSNNGNTNSNGSANTPAANEEPLTDAELEKLSDIITQPEYVGFLLDPFNSPADLKWNDVLEEMGGIATTDISEEERQQFMNAVHQKEVYGDLFKIKRSDLEEYAKSHTGVDFNPDDSFLWTYLEDYDAYYKQKYEGEMTYSFLAMEGTKAGNRYSIRFRNTFEIYNYATDADRILVFTMDGDNITVESNTFLWEDNCDAAQTFDVELNPKEGPVHFITYNVSNEQGSEVCIVKDGMLQHFLGTYISEGEDWGYMTAINAVSFFDFNADGIKDIVIIGDSKFGAKALLYESVNGRSYEQVYDLPEKLEAEFGEGITINQIKSYIMGDNSDCVFNSYQEAYTQIAKLSSMASDEYTFDLIYIDNDDIPELVVNIPGYRVSTYSFKDGHAVCWMHSWPYGAMGNDGYYYSPKNNALCNHNYDYAGAVEYDYYMSTVPDDEIDTNYVAAYVWFDDADGDGYPSESELETMDYGNPYETGYYCVSNKNVSDEESKKEIERLDKYTYEEICGTMNFTELMNKLNK